MKIYADRAPTSSEVTKTGPGVPGRQPTPARLHHGAPRQRKRSAKAKPDRGGGLEQPPCPIASPIPAAWPTGSRSTAPRPSWRPSLSYDGVEGVREHLRQAGQRPTSSTSSTSNVLDPARPTPAAAPNWITKLNGGFKRSAMMAQFSESNEFKTKSRPADGSRRPVAARARLEDRRTAEGHGAQAAPPQFNGVDSVRPPARGRRVQAPSWPDSDRDPPGGQAGLPRR